MRWFKYVQKRSIDELVRRVNQTIWSSIKRGRERLRQTLGELIERDLLVNDVPKELMNDRVQ